jgi:hypothetical protein
MSRQKIGLQISTTVTPTVFSLIKSSAESNHRTLSQEARLILNAWAEKATKLPK